MHFLVCDTNVMHYLVHDINVMHYLVCDTDVTRFQPHKNNMQLQTCDIHVTH
jgi:hypothetical protein